MKNRPVFIAIISLAIIGGVSAVIFLEENISISDRAVDVNTLFIKSDKLNPNIPTGQWTKWIEENNVRTPPPLILSEREHVVITDPDDITLPPNIPDSAHSLLTVLEPIYQNNIRIILITFLLLFLKEWK